MGTFNAGAIEASLTLDRSQFVRELKNARAQAKRFEQDDIELEIKVKSGDLTRLEQRLKSIKNNLSIDLNIKQAMLNAQVLKDLLNSMTPHTIRVSIASSAAKVSLTALERRLRRLDTTARIRVDVDDEPVRRFGQAFSSGRGQMQQWQAILLAILVFLPILSAAIGVAGAAIMALLASIVAATGGAIILAVGLAQVWTAASKAKNATGKVKEFQDALKDTKKIWADAMKAIQPTALKVLIQALNLARNAIPKLVPVFNAFGTVALQALTGLSNWFNGPEGQAMLDWFQTFGAEQFGTLLTILGNLGRVVLNLLYAFSPLAKIMMDGFKNLTDRWVEWSSTISQSDGFQRFIDYTVENGPKILDMLGSLLDAFINIGVAVAPLAGPMLDGLTAVFDFIAQLDPATLGLIVTGVTALWLGFQGVSAAMGVIGAIMAGGWVALIVVAVVAVVAVVMYLWHTSEAFRDKASEIWTAISTFVGTALTAIRDYFNDIWPDLKAIIEAVWPVIRAIIEFNLQYIWATVKIVWAGVVAIIKIAAAIISTVIHVLAALLRGDIPGALSAMKAGAVSILNALWVFIKSVFGAIGGFLRGSVGAIKTLVVSTFSSMGGQVKAGVGAMKASIFAQFSAILARIRDLRASITGVFATAGSWLSAAGRRIIQGLIDGIRSMIGVVRGLLNNLTGMIPDWKGPESVDRKLLKPSGKWIMQSLIDGVDELLPKVQRKFNSVTDMVRGAGASAQFDVSGTVAPVAAGANVTFNVYNPVAEKSSVTATREMTSIVALGVI